jgi:hypothetical protein
MIPPPGPVRCDDAAGGRTQGLRMNKLEKYGKLISGLPVVSLHKFILSDKM